ncbi:MAG: hypothetical protein ACYC56_07970 [Candidatus Aquicultor sp.]
MGGTPCFSAAARALSLIVRGLAGAGFVARPVVGFAGAVLTAAGFAGAGSLGSACSRVLKLDQIIRLTHKPSTGFEKDVTI